MADFSPRIMSSAVMDTTSPLYSMAYIILKIEPLSSVWITNAFPITAFEAVKAYVIYG